MRTLKNLTTVRSRIIRTYPIESMLINNKTV